MPPSHSDHLILTNAEIVTPDRVVPNGTVAIEHGVITDVRDHSYPTDPHAIDLSGGTVIPGFVCLHNDAIEREINPRPGAELDPAFALLHLDRKLAAAGVTTQFHAVSFSERESVNRTLDTASALCVAIAAFHDGPVATIDHQALLRLDLRTPGSLDALLPFLDGAAAPLLSLNDHVPGQGQFRDLAAFRKYLSRDLLGGVPTAQIDLMLDDALREAAATEDRVVATLERLVEVRASRPDHRPILMSHDDDSAERVDHMHGLGCRLAEFPLTFEAAQRARDLGMAIQMGAANAFRGGSLSNNVGARDLLARGLVDILVADYHAPAMLAAVDTIVALDLATLPGAVNLVTRNPAEAVGLSDRGAIIPGRRADLLVIAPTAPYRSVQATFVGGAARYASAPLVARLMVAGVG